ncbi:MAG: PfkB family carbohydrate kinase [Candidatus Puniceispirillaceae bacterium]
MTFAAKPILVIGGSNKDIHSRTYGTLHHLSDSHPGQICEADGGVARNIAEALARLKLPVSFITALGTDEAGQKIADNLIGHDVDISASLICDDRQTDQFLTVHDKDGELIIAINQMSAIEAITADYVTAHESMIGDHDYVICDCNLSEETLAKIAQVTKNAYLAIDGVSGAKVTRIISLLDKIDLLKLSHYEACILTGCPKETTPTMLIQTLCNRGAGQILLSDGPNGFYINEGDHIHHIKAANIKAEAVSGAGDCLMAGFVYGLYTGCDIALSASYGRRLAELSMKTISATNAFMTVQALATQPYDQDK